MPRKTEVHRHDPAEYGQRIFLYNISPIFLFCFLHNYSYPAAAQEGGGVKLWRNEDILDHAITVSYGTELKVTNVSV